MICGLENAIFAPTKQNLLCEGRSGLAVLFESLATNVDRSMVRDVDLVADDSLFVDETALVVDAFEAPDFTYVPAVKSTNLKLVLALDVSADMNAYWSPTRDALYRLIGQLLPSGTDLSIVTVGQDGAKVVVHSAVVKESNRQGLHGRIPFRLSPTDVTACLECGTEVAQNLVDADETTEIILISSGPEDQSSVANSTRHFGKADNVHHIFFRPAVTSDGGDSYNPNSYLVPSSPHFMIRQHLSEIFLSVLKSSINGPHLDCTFKKTWTDNPAEVSRLQSLKCCSSVEAFDDAHCCFPFRSEGRL